jgi:heptosyltransferase-2
MKFLIVAPAWIGDAVLSQPLLTRLKHQHPEARIDVLAPRWVSPVYARMPEVAHLLDNPFRHGELALRTRFFLGRSLVREAYDRAYVLPNSLKAALVPFFSGVPERIGFVGESRYGLLNQRHVLDKVVLPQMAERYAQLAEPIGSPVFRPLAPLHLESSAESQQQALSDLGLTEGRGRRPIVFCPGAEFGPAKRWPASHFATLARVMVERGHPVWLLGSGKDKPIGDEIVASTPGSCRNLCGLTSLEQAIDLIAQAELVVSNDSGLMHVAAALNRPLIAIYGSSSPEFTPPRSESATVVRLNLECSPCYKRECPLGHLDCLQELEPTRVLDACLAKL